MKFNTGLFDSLFGKKTTLQVPQKDGTTREISVTEAWFKKMKAEGKISEPSDTVPCHVIGPDGSETWQMRIGVDIQETQYQQLRDPKDGALYALTVYEKGVPKTTVIRKQLCEQAKAQFDELDRESE